MPQFPVVDPIPVPAPIWLLKVLHNLTFALHLTSVGLLAGGLLIGLTFGVLGRLKSSGEMVQASGMIIHRLPTVMAFVINLGIPPLLFAQVLYGRALYTSSVLIGAYWISVIFLLMASYFGLYVAAKRADENRRWTAPAFAALLLVLVIAFIYSNNMTLMLRPQAWVSMYQSNPHGAQLSSGDPSLLPRWFFMIFGTLPIAGAALILLSLRRDPIASFLKRSGGLAMACGIVAQSACAYLTVGAQPQGVMSSVMSNPLYRSFAFGWIATAGLIFLVGAASIAGAAPKLIAIAAGLAAFLNVASTVMVRDGIRDATLLAAGFDVWNRRVVANWSVLGLFLVLLIGAAGVIIYLVFVVSKARRIEEKYA